MWPIRGQELQRRQLRRVATRQISMILRQSLSPAEARCLAEVRVGVEMASADFPGGTQLDVELVDDGSGGQALRISNAVTSGNYDTTWPFAPAVDAAGENETNNVFSFSVDFKSATTDAQPGASIDITPGLRGTAVRQGLLRVVDNGATGGLSVGYFETVENGSGGSVFQFVELANNLDRSVFRPFADSCGKTAWQGTGMSSVER